MKKIFMVVLMMLFVFCSVSHALETKVFQKDVVKEKPSWGSHTMCFTDDSGWLGNTRIQLVFNRGRCDGRYPEHQETPYWVVPPEGGKYAGLLIVFLNAGRIPIYVLEESPNYGVDQLNKKVDTLQSGEAQRIADEKAARDIERQAAAEERTAERGCKVRISKYNQEVRNCARGIRRKRQVLQRVFDQYDDKDRAEYGVSEEVVACTCGLEDEPSMCEDNANYQPVAAPGLKDCAVQAVKDVLSLDGLF